MFRKRSFIMVFAIFVFLFVGVLFLSCDNGSGSGNAQKVLVVVGMPESIFLAGYNNGGALALYPPGSTVQNAIAMTNIVAGAYFNNTDIANVKIGSSYNVTVPLYLTNGTAWTGGGTYDVYCIIQGYPVRYYKAANVNFSGGATIQWSSVTEVFP